MYSSEKMMPLESNFKNSDILSFLCEKCLPIFAILFPKLNGFKDV